MDIPQNDLVTALEMVMNYSVFFGFVFGYCFNAFFHDFLQPLFYRVYRYFRIRRLKKARGF